MAWGLHASCTTLLLWSAGQLGVHCQEWAAAFALVLCMRAAPASASVAATAGLGLFEKMISGLYMGEVARRLILR